jgi:hypothetical protein
MKKSSLKRASAKKRPRKAASGGAADEAELARACHGNAGALRGFHPRRYRALGAGETDYLDCRNRTRG